MIIGWNWSEELIRGTVRWYFKQDPYPALKEIKKCLFWFGFRSSRHVTAKIERWPDPDEDGRNRSESSVEKF